MARGEGFDNVEMLGSAVGDVVRVAFRVTFGVGMFALRMGSLGFARGRAARQARAGERASRRQQKTWFEAVERQKARGDAGFASEAEAQAALRGKGGRQSKLDDRMFD